MRPAGIDVGHDRQFPQPTVDLPKSRFNLVEARKKTICEAAGQAGPFVGFDAQTAAGNNQQEQCGVFGKARHRDKTLPWRF